MTSYVSADLRRLVASRAGGVCEYCLIHEDDTYTGCQVDHIISEKHGGLTAPENLAYACTLCNRAKGTDVGSVAWTPSGFIRLFNSLTFRRHPAVPPALRLVRHCSCRAVPRSPAPLR